MRWAVYSYRTWQCPFCGFDLPFRWRMCPHCGEIPEKYWPEPPRLYEVPLDEQTKLEEFLQEDEEE